MQTTFIEENLNHQQIVHLCQFINFKQCKALEFRRCTISDLDFEELMKSLSTNSTSLVSLIFNIQMINEQNRFQRFCQMISKCVNLVNLRVHGNNINDDMFTQLYSVLHDNCLKLTLLDIGDNQLSNRSIVNLCTLIVPDAKRTGLEELILSANRLVTSAGWTELFFSISFNSRIRRLALDYNIFDDITAAMLSMIIASSRTLTYLDLECCNLSEYVGQLFLTLLTRYPVKLEEIYLEKNSGILESTRQLISECVNLKSRQNSISSDQPLIERLPIHDDDSMSASSTISDAVSPVKLRKKKKKITIKEPINLPIKNEAKSVAFVPVKKQQEEEEIEELQPIDIEPHGTAGRTLYWNRV